MVKIDLKGCSAFVKESELEAYIRKAEESFDLLESGQGAGGDFLGWRRLPSRISETQLAGFERIRENWQAKGVDLVTVIGIGGSYLGARCAVEALSHGFAAQLKDRNGVPDLIFAGNSLSEEYLAELLDVLSEHNVACVVISKSGTTTEPAVAFRIVKQFIEEKYKDARDRIVAITDASRGALKTLADRQGYRTFTVPDDVGGRFSVLSPVGLLPIALAGIDVRALLSGAREMETALSARSGDNPAIRYAAVRNLLYAGYGKSVEVLVSYHPKLAYFGEWWKQLFGESEGKDGKGLFPASAQFTTDLHSLGQFIQDGSRILFETVLNVENSNRSVIIGKDEHNLDGLDYLAGRHVEYCNEMARLGTRLAHIDGGVPQVVLSIDRLNARTLGALFYFFEFSCGISAYLLGVNPFNQPGVEAYKKNMFALLEKPGYEEAGAALRARL